MPLLTVSWLQAAGGTIIAALLAMTASLGVARMGQATNKEANRLTGVRDASTADVSAGQLALQIASGLRDEVTELQKWKGRAIAYAEEHERWDDVRDAELEKVAPGSLKRLPPRPRLRME